MNEKILPIERFENDIKNHEMSVLLDQGLYRHIRFARPGTSCMSFDLITYPGYLCYSGDMGTFVFSRLRDMFEFFRHTGQQEYKYRIDFRYWAEKAQAVDSSDGLKRFSPDTFAAKADEWLKEFAENQELSAVDRKALEQEVESIKHLRDSRDFAYQALADITHNGQSVFQDFWEVDCNEWSFRFLWCCYALVWGIEKYDSFKAARNLENG